MLKLALAACFMWIIGLSPVAAEPPKSFAQAKRFLADLHEEIGHLTTVYCGCSYTRTTKSGGKINKASCNLKTRKNETRASRVEWEHVVPASWFGQTRVCWQLKNKAYPTVCTKSNGKSMTGRKCCEKANHWYDLAHNDPNNLFPSSGEVNADRSNYRYGEVPREDRKYGKCDFEMGGAGANKVAEPGERVRGTLARAMLYMSQVYGVNVKLPMSKVLKWHKENPPSAWEIKRAKLIAERTGLKNQWIVGK
jgi:deoxyribonuclease I